jgi:PHD/YefM family antitoxin component YafN of YafNO toxin-antitoxin module
MSRNLIKPRGSRFERGSKLKKEVDDRYIVNEEGQRKAIILPIEEYEELLEDLHDLAVIAERRDEPTVSFGELKEKLKEDGLL